MAKEVYDTSVELQWNSPSHCGGRTDCYYQIRINNGPAERYDPTNFNFSAQETYSVNNLQQDTTYCIAISVHNGVSDQDADNEKLRECSIVVKTVQGGKFDYMYNYINIMIMIMSNSYKLGAQELWQ